MSVDTSIQRSPTTGEPVSTVARRNRLGVWLCIASDITGTVALLIAYSYLWSLNVNDAWAPPGDTWANPLPFWFITVGVIAATLLMWWGVRGVKAGNQGRLITASVLSSLVLLATFIGQIVQLSTFPFGPSDGAYASATFWLALSAAFHLFMVIFLATAVMNRTRRGLISPQNPSHAHFVAMFMTWASIAIFLGALFATLMTESPNTSSPPFGEFSQAPASAPASPAASPAASSPAAPSASPSASSGS